MGHGGIACRGVLDRSSIQVGRVIFDTHMAGCAKRANQEESKKPISERQRRRRRGTLRGILRNADLKKFVEVFELTWQALPKGYVPTAIDFDDAMVARQSFDFTKVGPDQVRRAGRDVVSLHGRSQSNRQGPAHGETTGGRAQARGELKFQECNDRICKLPQTVRFESPLTIQPQGVARRRPDPASAVP